jgi:hypothetical protein
MDAPKSTESTTPAPGAPSAPRRRRWPTFVAAAFVGLIALGGSGFFVASTLEEHDTFCIACHTVPEVTYYNRAYIAIDNPGEQVSDLATAHYQLSQIHNKTPFACIDCHRGDASLGQRLSTLALGGRDAVIYVLGKEDPTIEKTKTREGWLPNAACTNCHTDTLLTLKGLDNHFHTHLPQAAAALASGGTLKVADTTSPDKRADLLRVGLKTINTTLVCSDCHLAHKTVSAGAAFFMDNTRRNEACVSCHQTAKEGPQNVNSLQ